MTGSDLTALLEVKPGQAGSLRDLLLSIGADVNGNPALRFGEMPGVHFARFTLLEDGRRLLMNAVHDGSLEQHLDELARHGPGLGSILGHCADFPGIDAPGAFRDWVAAHRVTGGAFFRAHACSVAGVRRCLALRDRIDGLLSLPEVEAFLASLSRLPSPPRKPPPGRLARLGSSALGAIADLLLGALRLPQLPFAGRTSTRLGQEPALTVHTPCWLTEREHIVQNEMTIMLPTHPGLRGYLRAILGAAGRSLKEPPPDGTLAGVSTVHFGRWMMIDGGRSLLFVSNYDGAWESYIGEVASERVGKGLDLIWGCCRGYPAAGAGDIQAFKQVIIDHQARAEVFYSAYPDRSAKNILAAIRSAETLEALLEDERVAGFLREL
ncbi:MAG: hypothetical protein HYZ26_14695 [Chloroflexi bacterium]|nr:hypothetical protein [Chloroflexota bacterium]